MKFSSGITAATTAIGDSGGGIGGEELEELGFADFVNGVYRKAGVPATVSDIVVEDVDADWSSFDPVTGISADGLIGQPVVADALRATLLASGFTITGLIKPLGTIGSLMIDVYDRPVYSKEWKVEVAYDEDVSSDNFCNVSAASENMQTFAPVPEKDATFVFAATIAEDHVSLSVNGDVAVRSETLEAAIYNNIAIGTGAGTVAVQTMTFLPPQLDAALPALSTP